MKKIIQLEFINYKAFFGTSVNNKIILPEGNNVLIYGENGSGKTTIYEGLRQFFSSADVTTDVMPYRNINVPKTKLLNEGEANEEEVTEEVKVKLTFTDNGNIEEKWFGVPDENVKGTDYIRKANLLNSFLSYKELLRTYLMQDSNDKEEFKQKFAELLIEGILSNNRNSVTQNTYSKDWEDLFRPRAWYKVDQLDRFNTGLQKDITRINLVINEILKFFNPQLFVEIIYLPFHIDYYYSPKKRRTGNYPVYETDLRVIYNGINIDNGEENHLTVLNEARLSALAISIYLSALVITPQENFEYKLLFLDDIFIGLDMSNRLPLLEILTKFRKPILEEFVSEEDAIVERIREVNGIKQYERAPFFRSYQIFVTTYDRHWFEVAKYYLNADEWSSIEMYSSNNGEEIETPVVISPSLNYYEKAVSYFRKGDKDYPASGNYLRKEFERVLKELLYGKYLLSNNGKTGEVKLLEDLGDLWTAFYSSSNSLLNSLNFLKTEYETFDNVSKTVLNPLSHDNLSKPIYKGELETGFELLEKLKTIMKGVLIPAKSILKITTNYNGIIRDTYVKVVTDVLGYIQVLDNGDEKKLEIRKSITEFKVKPLRYEQGGNTKTLEKLSECDLAKAFDMVYYDVYGIKNASKLLGFNKNQEFVELEFGMSIKDIIDNM